MILLFKYNHVCLKWTPSELHNTLTLYSSSVLSLELQLLPMMSEYNLVAILGPKPPWTGLQAVNINYIKYLNGSVKMQYHEKLQLYQLSFSVTMILQTKSEMQVFLGNVYALKHIIVIHTYIKTCTHNTCANV